MHGDPSPSGIRPRFAGPPRRVSGPARMHSRTPRPPAEDHTRENRSPITTDHHRSLPREGRLRLRRPGLQPHLRGRRVLPGVLLHGRGRHPGRHGGDDPAGRPPPRWRMGSRRRGAHRADEVPPGQGPAVAALPRTALRAVRGPAVHSSCLRADGEDHLRVRDLHALLGDPLHGAEHPLRGAQLADDCGPDGTRPAEHLPHDRRVHRSDHRLRGDAAARGGGRRRRSQLDPGLRALRDPLRRADRHRRQVLHGARRPRARGSSGDRRRGRQPGRRRRRAPAAEAPAGTLRRRPRTSHPPRSAPC